MDSVRASAPIWWWRRKWWQHRTLGRPKWPREAQEAKKEREREIERNQWTRKQPCAPKADVGAATITRSLRSARARAHRTSWASVLFTMHACLWMCKNVEQMAILVHSFPAIPRIRFSLFFTHSTILYGRRCCCCCRFFCVFVFCILLVLFFFCSRSTAIWWLNAISLTNGMLSIFTVNIEPL